MDEDGSAAPAGPLAGLRVVEVASIGPGPHCAMLLADMGAEVLRIDRAGGNGWPNPVVDRGRARLELDLRTPAGRDTCLDAVDRADMVIEGFRPGVMERLGLGPEVACARNPRLVYGRITGWGQTGPRAHEAGHDINYVALAGALAAIGRPVEPAVPPLNLVGDFGGGSMFLAFGSLAALLERERSGRGQVVDAAIVDGVSSLMAFFTGLVPAGLISLDREESLLGGAAPFYRCYLCADGREVAVGAIEPHFYRNLLEAVGAPSGLLDEREDRRAWPCHVAVLATLFAAQDAAHWKQLTAGRECCLTPILPLAEVAADPHMRARLDPDGEVPPAPRLSRTPGRLHPAVNAGVLLARWRGGDAGAFPAFS